ncbi:hypothetical protein BH20GEM1_BH20GEM1_14060 [soil metagenome]
MPASRSHSRARRFYSLALVAVACLPLACSETPVEPPAPASSLAPASAPGRYVPGRVLVRFRTGADETALARAAGAAVDAP